MIDVLIPAYNAAATIAESLASLQAQTHGDLRIHVVDDGSTDGTGDVVRALAVHDPRIELHTKPNGGVVDALNHGLQFCTTPLLARLDADDIAYPERIAKQVAFLDAHPDVVACAPAARHIDTHGRPTGSFAFLPDPARADPFFQPCQEPYVMHPFLLVRRAAVAAIGGYREVHYAEDTDLYWRLLAHGRLVNLPEVLGDYRLHNESVSGRSIVNGRIMSVSSQLTALSERRRRRGVTDLEFRAADMAAYRAAVTLGGMVEVALPRLDAEETRYLRESTAAKLLELTAYRPYELEASDCDYIGALARRGFAQLTPANRGELTRRISGAAARLAMQGRLGDALRMVAPRQYPGFLARYAMRAMLPEGLQNHLRRQGTRQAPVG